MYGIFPCCDDIKLYVKVVLRNIESLMRKNKSHVRNITSQKLLLCKCKTIARDLGKWFAVDKLSKMVAKFGKTVADTSKSHIFYPEKYDFLSLKVILFVCLATELQILPTVSPVLSFKF